MALKTACQRLNYARKRIEEKGWVQTTLRDVKYGDAGWRWDGPGCLVGSLVDDDEFERYKTGEVSSVYAESARQTLPGLIEAFESMGFKDGHATYMWNDEEGRSKDEVTARIDEGRAKVCPDKKAENELGTGQPA